MMKGGQHRGLFAASAFSSPLPMLTHRRRRRLAPVAGSLSPIARWLLLLRHARPRRLGPRLPLPHSHHGSAGRPPSLVPAATALSSPPSSLRVLRCCCCCCLSTPPIPPPGKHLISSLHYKASTPTTARSPVEPRALAHATASCCCCWCCCDGAATPLASATRFSSRYTR